MNQMRVGKQTDRDSWGTIGGHTAIAAAILLCFYLLAFLNPVAFTYLVTEITGPSTECL